jgi:hypothetical protein
MVPADRRDRWPRDLLADRRATHLWDEGKTVGREYAAIFESPGQVAWDMYLLFPAGGWSIRSRGAMQAWGVPILEEREKLTAAIGEIEAGAGG